MTIANLPPLGLKEPRQKRDPKRLARVAQLPCVICYLYGLPCASTVQVHHCIHGRYGRKRSPDGETIPLCEGHHLGAMDNTQIALHRQPAEWKRVYGADTDYLEWTNEQLEQAA